MPREYIYEPWTAPTSIQKKANCIIGKDYPKPGKNEGREGFSIFMVTGNYFIFCIGLVLQWLIMRLQAKSVERGWEKLMRWVALMPNLAKGRRWTHAEKCYMVTETRLTQPLLSDWRGIAELSDAQLLPWQLYTTCSIFSIFFIFSCVTCICHM